MCRFLDAGGINPLRALGRPASEKRRGTKSRSAGQGLGCERYGDFRLAAHSIEVGRWGDATRIPGRGGGEEREEASRASLEGVDGAGRMDCPESG